MSTLMSSINLDVPVSTAYNQWTQFEEFPRFMDGIESVTQIDDVTLRWVAKIDGVEREWTSEIVEQKPDEIIAWVNHEGPNTAGSVTFEPSASGGSKIEITMKYDPDTFMEKAAETLGIIQRRIDGDLRRFKDYIEDRGRESGAWRGEVHTAVTE